jgi:hypothetical protein
MVEFDEGTGTERDRGGGRLRDTIRRLGLGPEAEALARTPPEAARLLREAESEFD